MVFRIPEMLPLSLAKDTKQQTKWEDTMKKINLFNRNINSPSYRRRPVSGGIVENRHTAEARCPGQAKRGLAPQEIFHCETMKNINVCDAGAHMRSHWIPAFAGMTAIAIAALFATPSFAEPTELDKKTVASKAYVDTKQDKIETGLVNYDHLIEGTIQVPSLVSYDSTNGLVGNEIGILDLGNTTNMWQALTSSEMDNFVPTVRAVAQELSNLNSRKQNNLPGAWTSTTLEFAMASTGGQTIVLTPNAGEVGTRYITAGGSQPLTQRTGADNVILYINGTKTLAQYQTSNFGGTALTIQNHIKGALVSLELLKDVYSELNSKITNNALPTGTAGTVVTYNGVNAETGVQEFSERAVYDPANTYNAQTDATKLATAGFVETKQNKMTCAGWDSDTHTDEHCWLWSIE